MKDNNRNKKFKAIYDDPGFDELDDYDLENYDDEYDGLDEIDGLNDVDDPGYNDDSYDGGRTGRISHTNKFYDHNYASHDNRDFLIRRLRSLERRVTILWVFLIIMTICALVGLYKFVA